MATAICPVCLGPLSRFPFDGIVSVNEVVEIVRLKSCGHVFHKLCALEWLASHIRRPCPTCRSPFAEYELQVTKLSFDDCDDCQVKVGELEALRSENRVKDQRILELEAQIQQLRLNSGANTQVSNENLHGARFQFQNKFYDSTCMNCESKDHYSFECNHPPILRFKLNTNYDKWAPISTGNFTGAINFGEETAGTVIKFYQKKLKLLRNLSRDEVQAVFGFSFFDNACWKCLSPFHHRPSCDQEENKNLKAFCEQLHYVNHPPSDERRRRKEFYRQRVCRQYNTNPSN